MSLITWVFSSEKITSNGDCFHIKTVQMTLPPIRRGLQMDSHLIVIFLNLRTQMNLRPQRTYVKINVQLCANFAISIGNWKLLSRKIIGNEKAKAKRNGNLKRRIQSSIRISTGVLSFQLKRSNQGFTPHMLLKTTLHK